MDLPADPASVAAARGLVRVLHPWLDTEQIERCELVVSEIVTNAIRHGSPDSNELVVLELDVTPGEVHACVRDHGPAFRPPVEGPRPDQTGGFGLQIAQRLSTGFRIEHSPAGNAVRFTI